MRRETLAAWIVLTGITANQDGSVKDKWDHFQVGDFERFAGIGKTPDGSFKTSRKVTIVKITPEEVTLSEEESDGKETKTRELKVARPPKKTRPQGTKTGTEKLQVDGKTFECEIYVEQKQDATHGEVTTKHWICDAAPGGLVRQEVRGTRNNYTETVTLETTAKKIKYAGTEFTSYSLKSQGTLGDKKFECALFFTEESISKLIRRDWSESREKEFNYLIEELKEIKWAKR